MLSQIFWLQLAFLVTRFDRMQNTKQEQVSNTFHFLHCISSFWTSRYGVILDARSNSPTGYYVSEISQHGITC